MRFTTDNTHYTWGTASEPEVAMRQLGIDDLLDSVPGNGLVVDIGAGIGLSLSAAIHVRRPDINVLNVDYGFRLGRSNWRLDEAIKETVGRFDEADCKLLQSSDRWYKHLISGYAERIPLKSGVASLVVSYACVPEYTLDHAAALQESVRVLRPGGLAVFGPMQHRSFSPWQEAVASAMNCGHLSDHSSRTEVVPTAYGGQVEASFVSLRK